jgi:hypothetical protein
VTLTLGDEEHHISCYYNSPPPPSLVSQFFWAKPVFANRSTWLFLSFHRTFLELVGRGRSGFIPGTDNRFFLLHSMEIGSGSHPASYPMGTEGHFPERPGVKLTTLLYVVARWKMVELHFHSLICLHGRDSLIFCMFVSMCRENLLFLFKYLLPHLVSKRLKVEIIQINKAFCHLDYNAMWSVENQQTFPTNMSPPYSGFNSKQRSAWYLLHASFLLELFFDPELGGNMLLRIVGWVSMNYATLQPRITTALRTTNPTWYHAICYATNSIFFQSHPLEILVSGMVHLVPWVASKNAGSVSWPGCPGSLPGQVMWDLKWEKWLWITFSQSTSVSPANSHSTQCLIYLTCHPGLV